MLHCCCLKDKGNEILFIINIPPPLTTIAGLDGADHWLGLPCHRTSHQWTSSHGATLKPRFTHRHLILKRILSSIFLRQQQMSGCNLALLSHKSVCAASLSSVYQGRCPYVWTSALKRYQIQLFFSWILKWFCLISNLSQTHIHGPWHCKDASPTYSSFTVDLCFGPPITSRSLGMEFFCILYKLFGLTCFLTLQGRFLLLSVLKTEAVDYSETLAVNYTTLCVKRP